MHLKIAYSICHWTYHLKMSERLARSQHPNQMLSHMSDKFLPALLFGHESSSSVGLAPSKLPRTYTQNNQEANGSSFFDDTRPKIMLAGASSTTSSGRGSGSSTRAAPASSDLAHSETLYRNEIRKSIRNVLQHKNLPSSAPNRNSCISHFNNVNCVSNGVYGTASGQPLDTVDKNGCSSYYYKPYLGNSNQQLMYKNARQIINDDHSGIYLNSTLGHTLNNCLSASSPKNLNVPESIYQSYGNNNHNHGRLAPNSNSNTLTICSSKPSKFEQSYKAPVLFLNRGPATEYESRV
jgi:hypothetical protein